MTHEEIRTALQELMDTRATCAGDEAFGEGPHPWEEGACGVEVPEDLLATMIEAAGYERYDDPLPSLAYDSAHHRWGAELLPEGTWLSHRPDGLPGLYLMRPLTDAELGDYLEHHIPGFDDLATPADGPAYRVEDGQDELGGQFVHDADPDHPGGGWAYGSVTRWEGSDLTEARVAAERCRSQHRGAATVVRCADGAQWNAGTGRWEEAPPCE